MPPSSLPAAVRYDLWRVEIAVHAAGLDVTRDKEMGFAPRPTVGGCIARPTLNGHLVARQKFLPSNRSFRCVFVVEWGSTHRSTATQLRSGLSARQLADASRAPDPRSRQIFLTQQFNHVFN